MISEQKSTRPLCRSILVTDSGLGGLSVFNDIANQLEQNSPWEKVNLTYFNAWPAPHRGYNHFDTWEKRAQIFNNAMNAMTVYHPDQILIACNTLSVIYPHTRFSRTTDINVEGIVDHGVQMMVEKLRADPEGIAVVFGTPTTTTAKSHESRLVDLGISNDRIINIGCTNLAGYIEREPFSDRVGQMIQTFVKQAVSELGRFTGHVYGALCCTHFGYRQALFSKAFSTFFKGTVTLLNPNVRMAEQVLKPDNQKTFFTPDIKTHIVSQAVWGKEQMDAYLRLLTDISPRTRAALIQYEQNNNLFSVD
ncbi:hypothetical protein [Desulfobacula sp.]|uniref:hypothetical protein n=1 Tax=Desulfobacula sp. TaxID=2593537 RepID=UPI00261F464D|nr:hypothetical protein [Desulfobacula sp.]